MDWRPFYTTMAASTATVIGLLFIAIQVGSERFRGERSAMYRALALSTFNILFLVFFLPAAFLIPTMELRDEAITMLFGVAFGLFGIARNWLPVVRWLYTSRGRRERAAQTLWHFLGPLSGYLYLGYLAVNILRGRPEAAQTLTAFTILGLFSAGIRNSWNLVAETTLHKEDGETGGEG